MRFISYSPRSIIGFSDYKWPIFYLVHSYFLGFIDLGPECTPHEEPIVFPTLAMAEEYAMERNNSKQ
jgi:hypothetical protein